MDTIHALFSNPPALTSLVAAVVGAASALIAAFSQEKTQESLRKSHDEIQRLSGQIAGSITGGDGFAHLNFLGHSPGKFHPVIHLEGQYPLYDVDIQIVDVNSFAPNQPLHKIIDNRDRISLRTMTPGFSSMDRAIEFDFNQMPKREFSVIFVARNGGWNQKIACQYIVGHLEYLSVINRDGNEIYRNTTNNFPQPLPF